MRILLNVSFSILLLLSLRSKFYFLFKTFSETLSTSPFSFAVGAVFYPYETTGKITVQCVIISTSLDMSQEDKRF